MACYLCVDEGVWSPSDKVPKRVETVRWKPISESHGVKGQDQSNRVKLIKSPHAPSSRYRPTGTNFLRIGDKGRSCTSLVFVQVVRLQVYNLPVRNCSTTGVQGSPKLLVVINYVERVNPVPSPSGQANRKASCWRSGVWCIMKRTPCCNDKDTGWNITGSVKMLKSCRCLITRT